MREIIGRGEGVRKKITQKPRVRGEVRRRRKGYTRPDR
jgi:hypothetical protein